MLKVFKSINPQFQHMSKRLFSQLKSYGAGESHVQLALKISSQNAVESYLASLEPLIQEGMSKGLQSYFLDINLKNAQNIDHIPEETIETVKKISEKFKDFRFCGISCELSLDEEPENFIASKPVISVARTCKNIFEKKLHHKDTWLILREANSIQNSQNFDINAKALYSFAFGIQHMKVLYSPGYLPEITPKTYQSNIRLLHKDVDVGFSLSNNRAFAKELCDEKRKNSAEFLKFVFELGQQLCMIELHDYQMIENAYKEVGLGQGVLDFKLLLNMIKSMKFNGLFLIDATKEVDRAKANMKFITDLMSERNFELKNTKDILEFITHRKTKQPFSDSHLESIQSMIIP